MDEAVDEGDDALDGVALSLRRMRVRKAPAVGWLEALLSALWRLDEDVLGLFSPAVRQAVRASRPLKASTMSATPPERLSGAPGLPVFDYHRASTESPTPCSAAPASLSRRVASRPKEISGVFVPSGSMRQPSV